jgi:RNA polymerase sigma-70 factor (ECF subfamily)
MSEEQDAADVGHVLAGDVEAFAGIVRRWQGPLVTLAHRFCRDRDQAEEMAQGAFVTAFKSLEQWRSEGAFGSWLYAVAANVYRSEMRRKRPFTLPLDVLHDAVGAHDNTSTRGDADREELVRHMVATLPAKYRDVIVLFYFHRMDVQEAARSLGLAAGTVKARLHRARALLRRKLESTIAPEDWRKDR